MSLSDFFHPFGPSDLIIGVFLFLTFDVLGSFIALKVRFPNFVRVFNWVVGLSIFSFIWWVLKPIVQFNQLYIILLLTSIWLVLGRFWRPLDLFSAIWRAKLMWLSLIPLVPALFIKLSLPPYFGDEFYHYYSPAEIKYYSQTQIRRDLYYYLPQSLDNIYRLTFTLTGSYVPARLTHLLIVLSALVTIGLWMGEKWGSRLQKIWFVASPYFATNLVSTATSGLVDAATAAVVLVAIISLGEKQWLPAATFWGVGLGFKYSVLVPATAFGALTVLINLRHIRLLIRFAFPGLLLFITTGGYWLISNFVSIGNPIYPLGNLASFFAGWTIPLVITNWSAVVKEFSQIGGFVVLPLLFAISILVLFKFPHRQLIIFLIVGWIAEVGMVKLLGGFLLRYYYHWIFILWLIVLLPFAFKPGSRLAKVMVGAYCSIVAVLLVIQAARIIDFVYTREFTPQIQRDYARRAIGIDDWLKSIYPDTYHIITYCSQPRPEPETIYIFDPDLMWFTTNTQFKGFLVNCVPRAHDIGQEGYATPAGLLASSHPCLPDSQLPSLIHNSEVGLELKNYPYALKQRQYNNYLVCRSRQLLPALYELSPAP